MAVCRNSIRNGLKHHREKSHERAGLSTATNISSIAVSPSKAIVGDARTPRIGVKDTGLASPFLDINRGEK